jgi:hypothetical protein
MVDPINAEDLPTCLHAETVSELLSLAHAGDKAGFVAMLDNGNPDEVEARAQDRDIWIKMREDLGLPEWL